MEQITIAVIVSCWLNRTAAHTTNGMTQNASLKIDRLKNQLSKTIPLVRITSRKSAAVSKILSSFFPVGNRFGGFEKKFTHISIKGVTRIIPDRSPSHQVSQATT